MPLICKTHRNPVFGECTQFLDQAVFKFLGPFAGQERFDLRAPDRELGSVAPTAVRCLGLRNLCRIAAVPAVLRGRYLGNRRFSGKGRKGRMAHVCFSWYWTETD